MSDCSNIKKQKPVSSTPSAEDVDSVPYMMNSEHYYDEDDDECDEDNTNPGGCCCC